MSPPLTRATTDIRVGITGVGAAVANAVHDATGRRVTDLPITLDKVVG